MTESEWFLCADPELMYPIIKGKLSQRKWALYGLACARRVQHLMEDERSVAALDVTERYLEGQATEQEMDAARAAAKTAARVAAWADARADASDAVLTAAHAARAAWASACGDACGAAWASAGTAASDAALAAARAAQANLIREIVGNPFRPLTQDSIGMGEWYGMCLVNIHDVATRIYGLKDWEAMPILADALEDAGCANTDVLLHLRGPAEHVRGCWVLDVILGKE